MQISQSQIFLHDNDPQNNLNILAGCSPSDTASTRCMTQKVFQDLLPKRTISPETLREISLLGSGALLLSTPCLYLAKKVYDCGNLFFSNGPSKALQCKNEISNLLSDPILVMNMLCFGSIVSLAGIGIYAGMRWYFQDHLQEERFTLLDREYSNAAEHLRTQYSSAKASEKDKIVKLAKNLFDRKEWISASLEQAARLTAPQAALLTAKICHTAQTILSAEQRSIPKPPVQKKTPSTPASNISSASLPTNKTA